MSGGSPNFDAKLPFGIDFQKALLRLLMDDDGFAHAVMPHLQPHYFANEMLGWVYGTLHRYRERYGGMPSALMLHDAARQIDPRMNQAYHVLIDQIAQAPLREEQYMRDQTIDFCKRNIFVSTYQESRQLYNSGKVDAAYDLMMERMEQIQRTTWEPPDEHFTFDEFGYRHLRRVRGDWESEPVETGLNWLDHILNGGLHKGELGIWVAYAKGGKSTLLVNHGIACTRLARKRCAHFVFEGSTKQVETRYDAAMLGELYHVVKRGDITSEKFVQHQNLMRELKGLLWVRGFTERWDYSVVDIHDELKRKKRELGWEPDMIIVDYGDLLRGREKLYPNETEKQKAAFRDMKSLANRGYAVWTASQARRPEKGAENKPHFIHAREIADCYDKVRLADFLGSINATVEEKEAGVARLLAELYRDNAANQSLLVRADFSRMIIKEEPNLTSPSMTPQEVQAAAPMQHTVRV